MRASLDEYESHVGDASELASSFAEVFGENFKLLHRAVSLILYVCSDEAEIRDRDVPDWEPSFPRSKIMKGRESDMIFDPLLGRGQGIAAFLPMI